MRILHDDLEVWTRYARDKIAMENAMAFIAWVLMWIVILTLTYATLALG